MPTFQITGPDGKKFRVQGETAEGALAAVQSMTAGLRPSPSEVGTQAASPPSTPEGSGLNNAQLAGIARGKALAAARARGEDIDLPEVSNMAAATPRANPKLDDTAANRAAAFATAGVDGIQVIGPALGGISRRVAAVGRSLRDGTEYGQELANAEKLTADLQEQFPNAALAGNITGNIAAMGAAGATGIGGRALGLSQEALATRAGMSAASGGALSGADAAIRGGGVEDVAGSAALGVGLGAAIPLAGGALQKGYRAVADGVGTRIRGAINPERVAGEKVGRAIAADRANVGDDVLNAADNASAAINRQPLMNIDQGGENTRALARVAANTNPEARATINKVADERFVSQSDRGVDFVKRIMNGDVEDIAVQDRIRDIARITNRKAYDAAENAPQAASVWDDELAQLMQSPTVQKAASGATSRSADRVAVEGGKAVKNPFSFVNGEARLAKQPDGSIATPNLRYWDQVKRNLDSEQGVALRSGDKARAADIGALRSRLVSKLDGLVPEYKTARQGAAAAFGAEDAVEAGKVFARTTRNLPEMEVAVKKMTPAEKKGFEIGYASEIIDKIRATNDRTSAVRMFKTPEMRAKFDLALGPQKTRELESFIRVEDAMDRVRGALGNSTTARQLREMAGIGAIGGGASIFTGDPRYAAFALAGAATRYGVQRGAAKIDEAVMKKVAALLVDNDPAAIEKAVRSAAFSPEYLRAVEAIADTVGIVSRASAASAAQ